jgi:hypothetical protein
MTTGPRRVAAVPAAVVALWVVLGSLPLLARSSPGSDPQDARQLKLEGFAPVSGTFTTKKGKQVEFVAIAYREAAMQGGTEATGAYIRTWGQGEDGRYECMVPFKDLQEIRFLPCPDGFPKRATCATVESRDGEIHEEESFRSDFAPGEAWLFLILRTEKGKEVSIGLDRAVTDSWIEFDG